MTDHPIVGGVYRHFKGNLYIVVGIARDSETLADCVVYHALYGDFGLWVRPLSMFLETVTREGVTVPRFTYLETAEGDPMTWRP